MSAELPLPDAEPLNADGLRARLRRKFPADQFAMLYEVRDASGHSARRSADVIMVGLWPSRGNQIEGMELKVSRSDWQRELAKPAKAEAFVKYCDRWWIVAADASIVRDDELPPTWGLMIAAGRGLKVIKSAPKLEPQPVDRSLLAAMLKRATDTAADSPEVRAFIETKAKSIDEEIEKRVSWKRIDSEQRLQNLQASVKAFEEASGVELARHRWDAGNIGAIVKSILNGQHEHRLHELGRIKDQVRRLHEWLEKEIPTAATESETQRG